MGKGNPSWLPQIREFCKTAGISIMAWGQDALVVEAKSSEHREEVARQLQSLGFEPVDDEEDAYAGMLTLKRKS